MAYRVESTILFDPTFDYGEGFYKSFYQNFLGVREKRNQEAYKLRLEQTDPEQLYELEASLIKQLTELEKSYADILEMTATERGKMAREIIKGNTRIAVADRQLAGRKFTSLMGFQKAQATHTADLMKDFRQAIPNDQASRKIEAGIHRAKNRLDPLDKKAVIKDYLANARKVGKVGRDPMSVDVFYYTAWVEAKRVKDHSAAKIIVGDWPGMSSQMSDTEIMDHFDSKYGARLPSEMNEELRRVYANAEGAAGVGSAILRGVNKAAGRMAAESMGTSLGGQIDYVKDRLRQIRGQQVERSEERARLIAGGPGRPFQRYISKPYRAQTAIENLAWIYQQDRPGTREFLEETAVENPGEAAILAEEERRKNADEPPMTRQERSAVRAEGKSVVPTTHNYEDWEETGATGNAIDFLSTELSAVRRGLPMFGSLQDIEGTFNQGEAAASIRRMMGLMEHLKNPIMDQALARTKVEFEYGEGKDTTTKVLNVKDYLQYVSDTVMKTKHPIHVKAALLRETLEPVFKEIEQREAVPFDVTRVGEEAGFSSVGQTYQRLSPGEIERREALYGLHFIGNPLRERMKTALDKFKAEDFKGYAGDLESLYVELDSLPADVRGPAGQAILTELDRVKESGDREFLNKRLREISEYSEFEIYPSVGQIGPTYIDKPEVERVPEETRFLEGTTAKTFEDPLKPKPKPKPKP